MNNSINNKIKKLANKLNLNIKEVELDNSDINNNITINNVIEEKTNDITNNDIKELNIKLMNEIANTIKQLMEKLIIK